MVVVLLQQRLQRLLLVRRQLRLVTLGEGQEGLLVSLRHNHHLVPQHGELAVVVLEAEEVRDQRVDHHVGQRVLLVEQHRHEQRRRARVPAHHAHHRLLRQLRQLHQRGGGVRHGDGDLGDDGADDHRLLERALVLVLTHLCLTHLAQGDHNSFEERRRLVHRLLQRLVEVVVELSRRDCARQGGLVTIDVVQNRGEQHRGVEALGELRVEVGGEDTRGGEGGLGRPLVRLGDPENLAMRRDRDDDLLPVAERRDDLERLGKLAGAVARVNARRRRYC